MKRERIYWICQLSGWSIYVIANMLIFAAFGASPKTVLSEILICGFGLVLTHCFRLVIKRRGWVLLPLRALGPGIVAAYIALAIRKVLEHKQKVETTDAQPSRSDIEQVFVRDGERCWFVKLNDIRLLESKGNYTRLYSF